jgi:hypothetical protein
MIFIGDKAAVALFVEELLATSGLGWLSITIINRGPSEDCYVSIVTDTLSEGTVKELATNFCLELTNISILSTQVG